MADDRSGGWEAVSAQFIAARSNVGAEVVRQWSKHLPPNGAIVDIGCGAGIPVSEVLDAVGFQIFGIDASPSLIAAFRRRFPSAQVACEAAEDSRFFDRKFDGAVAVGLMFLLPEDSQRRVIEGVAAALNSCARFLFSAPQQVCEWDDMLTGRPSRSLGIEAYQRAIESAGMQLVDSYSDEGGNHYYDARLNTGRAYSTDH